MPCARRAVVGEEVVECGGEGGEEEEGIPVNGPRGGPYTCHASSRVKN